MLTSPECHVIHDWSYNNYLVHPHLAELSSAITDKEYFTPISPLAPNVASVTLVANDKGDNRSPSICLTAEEKPRKPQVGDRLMKGLCNQSSPKMGPFPPNEFGKIAQHIRKGEGRKWGSSINHGILLLLKDRFVEHWKFQDDSNTKPADIYHNKWSLFSWHEMFGIVIFLLCNNVQFNTCLLAHMASFPMSLWDVSAPYKACLVSGIQTNVK